MCLLTLQDDGNEPLSVPLSTGDECIAGQGCVSCLSAHNSLIIFTIGRIHHLMPHRQFSDRGNRSRGRKIIAYGGCYLAQRLILKRRLCNQRHIPGSRIVIRIIQSIRIDKMRIGTSKGSRLLIHQIGKAADASGHMLGQAISHFIGRFQ